MTAGPDEIRGPAANQSIAFDDALTQAAFPRPRYDRFCHHSASPLHPIGRGTSDGEPVTAYAATCAATAVVVVDLADR